MKRYAVYNKVNGHYVQLDTQEQVRGEILAQLSEDSCYRDEDFFIYTLTYKTSVIVSLHKIDPVYKDHTPELSRRN